MKQQPLRGRFRPQGLPQGLSRPKVPKAEEQVSIEAQSYRWEKIKTTRSQAQAQTWEGCEVHDLLDHPQPSADPNPISQGERKEDEVEEGRVVGSVVELVF